MKTKTLKAIQILARIGKILSIIAYIGSMIGAIACAVGAGLFAVYGKNAISTAKDNMSQIEDEQARQILEKLDVPMLITMMAIAAAFCVAGCVVAHFAKNYFKHELEDGTPFTMRGAKELMRLGILYICVNLGISVVAGAVWAIAQQSIEGLEDEQFHGVSIGLGIIFIIVSLICRYGAELTEGKTEAAPAAVEAAPAAEEAAPAAEEAAPAAEGAAPAAEEAPAESAEV